MAKKSIWVLTSVACDYDQPPNNLEAWWSEKPTLAQLAKFLYPDNTNEYTIPLIQQLLDTGHLDIKYSYDYSLFQWEEED